VTAHVRSGDRITVGGARIVAELAAAAAPAVPLELEGTDPPPANPVVTDQGDGTYTVACTVPAPGEYRLSVHVQGQPVAGSPLRLVCVSGQRFDWETEGDVYGDRGILYHLATAGGTAPWANPHPVVVEVTTMAPLPAGFPSDLVGNATAANCFTANAEGAWMAVDLRTHHVIPTAYVLSGRRDHSNHHPRSWVLQGSRDGVEWTTLHTHTQDATINDDVRTGRWRLDQCPVSEFGWSRFRIALTGPDAFGTHHLVASGLELYGVLLSA
jgi:hypothetical protein